MKTLETSYNTPNWTLIEGNKPRAEEEKSDEIASAPSTESAAMVQVHYVYNASLALDPGLPRTYGEAMAGPIREKWAAAVVKEIKNFDNRKVWVQVPQETMGRG